MNTNDFVCWWDTDTHFLGIVKYLAGVDLDIIYKHGTQAKSAAQLLTTHNTATTLRALCRLRARLLNKEVSDEVALEQLKEIQRQNYKLFVLNEKYSDTDSLIEAAIYFLCPKVSRWFPVYTNTPMMRGIFSRWPAEANPIISRALAWRGGSACITAGMIAATTDKEFFNGAVCHSWNNWPNNLLARRCHGFGDGIERTTVIVDGENVKPGQFYVWLQEKLYLTEQECGASELPNLWFTIICNKNTAQIFDFILDDLGLQGEVRIDHRVLAGKSTVDFKIYSEVFDAYYQSGIRNFIIVSSDSDFWGLPSEVEGAKFTYVYSVPQISGDAWHKTPGEFKKQFDQMDYSLSAHNNFAFKVNYLVSRGLDIDAQIISKPALWCEWVNTVWGYPVAQSRAARFARQRLARVRQIYFERGVAV